MKNVKRVLLAVVALTIVIGLKINTNAESLNGASTKKAVRTAKIGTYCSVTTQDLYVLPNGEGGWRDHYYAIDYRYYVCNPINISKKEISESERTQNYSKKYQKYVDTMLDFWLNAKTLDVTVTNPDDNIEVFVSTNKQSIGICLWEQDVYKKHKYVLNWTCKYKGKKYRLMTNVYVITEQPFKSIKLNKTEMVKDWKWANNYYSKAKTNKEYALTWKLKKGYKVVTVEYGTMKKGSAICHNFKTYNMKKKLKFKSNYREITFDFEIVNPKGKHFHYYIDIETPSR